MTAPEAAKAQERRETIMQAVARGWCHPSTSDIEMDARLAEAIIEEVCAALTQEAGQPVGWKATPYEPTSAMLTAAREIDPALPIEHVRRLWWLLWRAAPRARPAPAVGQWQMVPLEPTPEMVSAGRYVEDEKGWSATGGIYRAMLAAAPQPPAAEVPRGPIDVSAFAGWTDAQKLGYVQSALLWPACGYVSAPHYIEGFRKSWKLISDMLAAQAAPEAARELDDRQRALNEMAADADKHGLTWEPAQADRDTAIAIWRKHCEPFSWRLGDDPPSVVVDAMLEFAAQAEHPALAVVRELVEAREDLQRSDIEYELRRARIDTAWAAARKLVGL